MNSTTDVGAAFFPTLRKTRVAALHDVLRFRLEHIVPLPLAAPRFVKEVFARAENEAAWKAAVDSGDLVDRRGAETTYAWGKIWVDRLSTGRVWAECIWKECDPALTIFRTNKPEDLWQLDQQGLWELRKVVGHGRLFDIDPIAPQPSPRATDRNLVDLTRSEDGAFRALSSDFRSAKARRVLIRLVGRSRFAGAYPDDAPGSHDVSNVSRADFEAALSGGPMPSGVKAAWLNATRAPAPPSLVGTRGTLHQRRFDEASQPVPKDHAGKTLTHTYRCWLDQDWFSSGEEEKLAVVCLDPSQANLPEWVKAKLSRWGGDMTMQPGAALKPPNSTEAYGPTFLSPTQIVGMTPASAALRPQSEGASPAVESRGVALALLDPKFHTGTGRWYCDIELAVSPAYRVSLQLSLARFQEHAIDGLQLSDTVMAETFFLPQPWTFSAVRRGAMVEVSALGPAYTARAPMTTKLKGAPSLQDTISQAFSPLVTVELERIDGGPPIPVMGSDGRPVITTNRASEARTEVGDGAKGEIPLGWKRWTMQLTIPPEEAERKFAVRFSLSSAHANSKAESGEDDNGALIHLPEPVSAVIVLPET